MRLGAHESSAGGCHLVFERCARDGAEAVQLWTRSSRQWAARALDRDTIAAFRRAHRAYAPPRDRPSAEGEEGRRGAVIPSAAHASYLINLATADAHIRRRSIRTLIDECRRAEALGVGQVIVHPGA